ncbi:hypothetical protein V1264_023781 [Littorina saxatilis]|uniref:Reelin domain-containing protein n=1 Tax=Littorina saxatilis TaxID=31220 RepID=A0AAN9B8W5_9CAEN
MNKCVSFVALSIVQDSVGHNSSVTKTLKSFSWTAPSRSPGHLYFRATFVQSAFVFWTTTISDFITDTSDTSDLPPKACDARTTFTGNGGHAVISNFALTVLMSILSARSYFLP